MFRLIRIFSASTPIASKWPLANNLLARYGTFIPREFQYETSDGESGTLMHRFSRHVSLTKRDYTDKTKYGFKVSNFYPLPDVNSYGQQIRDLTTIDLAKLITFTTDFRSKTDVRSYTEIVNALDEECVRRVQAATVYELLEMLHCFMYLLPNKIAQLKSYQSAMPKLIQLFGAAENERDFMSIVFFLGLWKRNKTGTILMKEFLQQYLDRYLTPELNRMDFVILANATYKTSLRMADESDTFKSRLIKEIVEFGDEDDSALLVTLIKCARMNRLSSEKIVEKVHSFTESNIDSKELDFRGLSHLFAYIADNRIKHDTLTGLFIEGCWNRFETEVRTNGFETQSQSCRPKDIATFLWSCATLGVPIETYPAVKLNQLEKAIRLKVDAGEYRYNSDLLVDTLLSLWICDRKSIALFRLLFKDKALVQNLRKERTKLESRKELLLTCAEIDLPDAWDMIKMVRKPSGDAFAFDRAAPEYLVRPGLKKVVECLHRLKEAKQLSIARVSFNAPVKHLNIAGILVQFAGNGEVKNLDVLDEKHCLSDRESPVGLMKLKARILEDKGIDQAMVNICKYDTPDALEEELKRILLEPKEQREQRLA
uniref:RAP domain-containing protein n=1 Tax=Anopheles epiroticus TaxID=199890 RepID=A0A182PZ71_9DIPT